MNYQELQEMGSMDIRKVKKEELIDVNNVEIDLSLPVHERVKNFIHDVVNPYCFKVGDVVVKTEFAGKCSIYDSMQTLIQSKLP